MDSLEQRVGLRRFGDRVLDFLLPPQCLACGVTIGQQGTLCASCWEEINFLAKPFCDICGYPFEFDPGEAAICAACLDRRPVYGRGRAVMRYASPARDLVLGFKHGDRVHGAPAFGRWLARAGRELLLDADLLVPVPLHWTRLFQRRFNQSVLMARSLSRLSGVPIAADLLVRLRRTPSQGRLNPAARRRNVQGAFALRPGREAVLAGRQVLLIDDVLTTGATMEACAEALLDAGAVGVDVLTLARVIR
ncbi:MAG: amidophosphoribosyltransferase [Rhodospirillaceae bacterium]|nr:MAG: amidophosphoribosyltransferase [Rhodospirillaceae bacterium]